MSILAINCGSSSIKADLYDDVVDASSKGPNAVSDVLYSLRVERASSGKANARIKCISTGKVSDETISGDFSKVLKDSLKLFQSSFSNGAASTPAISSVVHRIVHGGQDFSTPVIIDESIIDRLVELSPLAPLHNPVNLEGVSVSQQLFKSALQIAVFDTAFHSTLPRRARAYAIPKDIQEKHSLRRYGFHGTSHEYVAKLSAEYMGVSLRQLRMITLHLGSGCSAAAIEFGSSTETSMGFTPLEGLVMGTRCGDIDAGLLLHIARQEGMDIDALEKLCNKQSGLLGISGRGNDMRDLLEAAAEGDQSAQLAIHVFCHRATKYIGAYAAVMGGVDAIVFTAGVGENSAVIRRAIVQKLGFLGAIVDEELNDSLDLSSQTPVADISTRNSPVKIIVAKTDEQRAMVEHARAIIKELDVVDTNDLIPLGVSARHVHLTDETIEALFGKGHQLTPLKMLVQPGQFAAQETVTLHGPKNSIKNVRILGPARSINQVEISRTDEFFIGIDAPVRGSGNIQGTPGIVLEGPKGKVSLAEGVICAWRHIHMTPEDAKTFRVEDGDVVNVEVQNQERGLIFGNVLIRVSPKYCLEMHIDTDEANAAEVGKGAKAKIVHRYNR